MAISGVGQVAADVFNPMFGSAVSQNQNARSINATNDKWAPLLALNKSQGAANVPVKSADMASFLMPMLSSIFGAVAGGGGGGGGGGGADPTMGLGAATGAGAGAMGLATGGKVPRYSSGGGIQGVVGSLASLIPMIAMMASDGAMVPGKATVPGDSPANDTKLIAASPGEVVLPRTVAKEGMNGNKWKVAAYLNDVKKHGPGPMPAKSGANAKPGISPWAALCSGGKV